MKTKFTSTFFVFLFICTTSNAQWVVSDPGQSSQNATIIANGAKTLDEAIKAAKRAKELVDQGKKAYSEFVQIKSFLESTEERLKNIGDIKNLRLNKIENIMDKVLAIKTENYFSDNKIYRSVNQKTEAAFNHADKSNKELYNTTYASKIETLEANSTRNSSTGSNSISGKDYIKKMNEFNKAMKEGQVTEEAMSSYSSKMLLDLGIKYKAMSDELVKLSDEVSLAINLDKGDSRNIPLTSAERLKMMDMANQYQIQALEYEEKSARLLQEAAKINEEQASKAMQLRRNIKMKELINFHL